jgi:hypothetical protein
MSHVIEFTWHDMLFMALVVVCVPMLISRLVRRITRRLVGASPPKPLPPTAASVAASFQSPQPQAEGNGAPGATKRTPQASVSNDGVGASAASSAAQDDPEFDCTPVIRALERLSNGVSDVAALDVGTVEAHVQTLQDMIAGSCSAVNRRKNKQAVVCNHLLNCDGLAVLQVSCCTCRVSCVVCRVSCVVCRVSCVVCRVSCVAPQCL